MRLSGIFRADATVYGMLARDQAQACFVSKMLLFSVLYIQWITSMDYLVNLGVDC